MNLQQLEYIIAVDRHRHFSTAAEKCFVTQATLSMMIKKLEEELDVKIFDRHKQPVTPTREGVEIIERAKKIVAEAAMLHDFAKELKGEIAGEIRLGIIPTLAPYLLPLFLKPLTDKYIHLKISVKELITDEIIRSLKHGDLDMGILATPLSETSLSEHRLFYEEFFAYASATEKLPKKKYLLPKDMNLGHLWLLEEGHCLRNQMVNFCSLKKQEYETASVHYEAGSIETLINLVDRYNGITIVPLLATLKLSARQKARLHEFAPPKPVREISLVTVQNFPRKKMLQYFIEEIIASVSKNVETKNKGMRVVGIES